MGALLYIVHDTILLKNGPGLVVFAEAASEGAHLRVGDAVELRRADGSSVLTEVKAFPMVSPYDFGRQVPVSFPPEVVAEDVPTGTEVWSYP
jgi:hypothetical protein